MQPKIPIASITDEFSPDLAVALDAMAEIGMTGAELRMIGGKNIMDLDEEELARARDLVSERGMKVISIASPLLKCVLPGGPEVDTRFQHDVFASRHTFEDQPRLAEKAFRICKFFGAPILRVFSYWRTVEPEKCFDAIVRALENLATQAAQENLIIGLENEHACNVATAAETLRVLAAVNHPALQVVWDPANCYISGQIPFPEGYRMLPAARIAHVHVKDCSLNGHQPDWGPVGTRDIDWKGQMAALKADGYNGYVSLETHWPGPNGDKYEASWICGWNLRGLASL
ncbi:MAG: sugar phosphate isomerase/epimerase [Bryobacteraceae bacterium]|nr:sugar phosphate isomerase/epimerase [Bryobacteraceae bacterium]MDW8377634.1 sugar phosphate isomerase/epimerase family protein [Bryobacterales bacterium]